MKKTKKRGSKINNPRLKHFAAAVAGLIAVAMFFVGIGSLLKRIRGRRNAQTDVKARRKTEDQVKHTSRDSYQEPVKEFEKESDKNDRKAADREYNKKQETKKKPKKKSSKKYLKRSLMGVTAGLLAASLIFVSILSKSIEAEAAQTFYGIEKLREQVAESGKEYTILEIVPDRSAAEIGYLFDGYEPILSEWDTEEMKWRSWKEILPTLSGLEAREAFVTEKTEALRQYYAALGLQDKVPVQYGNVAYAESDTPQEGYVKCESDAVERTGWFEKVNGEGDAERYRIYFAPAGIFSGVNTDGEFLYYVVADAVQITADNIEELAETLMPDTVIYTSVGGAFVNPTTWQQLLEGGISIAEETEETETETEEGTTEETEEEAAEEETTEEGTTEEETTEEDGTLEESDTKEDSTEEESSSTGDMEESQSPETESPAESSEPESPDAGSTEQESPEEGSSDTGNTEESSSAESGGGAGTPEQHSEEPNSRGTDEPENIASNLTWRNWFRLSAEVKTGEDSSDAEPKPPEESSSAGSDTSAPEESSSVGSDTSTPEESSSAGSDMSAPEESNDAEPVEGSVGENGDEGSDTEIETETESEPADETTTEPETEINAEFVLDQAASDDEYEEGGYYLVSFRKIEKGESFADSTYVYLVNEDSILLSSEGGEYRFVDSEDENVSKQTYTFSGLVIYCTKVFANNEWFKKYVLNMEENDFDSFPVKVITLTPDELNSMEQLPEFDFLYLNSGLRRAAITETGGEENDSENGEGESGGENSEESIVLSEAVYAAGSCDLSESVSRGLFDRIVACALPCLVDGGILYTSENEGTVINAELRDTWIFKLAAVMCQESLSAWYEEHAGGISSISVNDLLDEMVEDDDHNFTTEQVYCKFGESIINSDFYTPTIYTEGAEIEPGFQNVLDEIILENLYRESDTSGDYRPLSTDVSQAEAVRHILNYQNRRSVETKQNIKVLEIQPAMADESEITLEQLQKWAPGVESADITVMTTAEFIGNIEKLNEIYDLIYIGTSKDHLNMRYWTDKQYTGKPSDTKIAAGTVFNDSDMDGLIYYNIGDKRVVTLPLGGLLTTEYWGGNRNDWTYFYNIVRYGGNDITEEKMNALTSFLDGAYPVIIADDFIEQPLTVFSETDYSGCRVNLSTGEYSLKDLTAQGIVASEISSLKVKEGYQVTVYSSDMFTGSKTSFTSDINNLQQHFNGSVASIKVEKSDAANPVRTVDGDHIDNCTYLYEFVSKALEDKYTNFYAWDDVQNSSELFKFYLNRPKISMVQTSANGTRQDGNEIYYITQGSNGKYNLEYHFTIQNEGAASMNTRYQCELYIDINSDGKYSSQEQVGDVMLTQNGAIVSSDDLYAGREYVLRREVPNGYKGLLPWKVEVTQVNNDNIYASMSGYTKLMGMEQEVLKICQINKNGSDVIDLNYEINTKGKYFNILVYGGYYGGVYYPGITEDFELDVTTINISQFETNFYKNPDYLNDFNMLILGFSDMYGDFSGTDTIGPMSAIVKFINSGKSVLLAHDTTSFFNSPGEGQELKGYPWRDNHNPTSVPTSWWYTRNAATLNKYIRPLVGMDRYGILQSDILQRGVALTKGTADYEAVVNSGKDVAYKPKSGKTETVPEVHGYNYATVTSKSQKVMTDQGTTNDRQYTQYNLLTEGLGGAGVVVFENQYKNIRYDNCYYWENYDGVDTGELELVRNGEVYNVHVTQVNKGQITEYPYKLKEEFEVAQTHAQYYELDYTADDDGDGQSDLVVWYCLGGRTSPTGHSEWESTVYSQSPNDVRNNYYIYNKGNITYTGMGHARQLGGYGEWYTFEEAKLFINTMIASYQAGVKPPYVSVLENGLPEAREIRTMYRYYDDTNNISLADEATADANEKIYFTVQDINFVKGTRAIATHVFYEAADGSEAITVGGVDIRVNRLADAMYNASDDSPVDANNLQSGGIYYILVPKSVLQQCDSGLKLYFEAQSTIITSTTTANVYVTDKIYAQLEVLKAYLFELD